GRSRARSDLQGSLRVADRLHQAHRSLGRTPVAAALKRTSRRALPGGNLPIFWSETSMTRLADRIMNLLVLPGIWVGWLVLPLMIFVCLTVVAAKVGWNAFWQWGTPIPVFGKGITVNTLTDMQWYIFALVSVLGGV